MRPAGARRRNAPIYNRSFIKPSHAHVNPLIRAWAAPPTLHIAGLHAIERVNTRNSGFTCEQRTMPDTGAPKTQTTSPLAARCQRFSPRWSAMWALHHLEQRLRRRQSGGIAPCKGATRRRHAARRLRMAQNPHRHRRGERRGHGEPGRSAREQRQGAAIARQLAQGLHQSTTLFAQQEPHLAASGQNSPSTPALAARAVQNSPRTPTLTACPVQNSPRSPKMAQFGAVSACRESFVPF